MKSNVEQINPVQYRVTVELTAEEVDKAFDNAFKKIQRKARVQGFRPGKAPLNIIKKLYSGQVLGEVHESLINTHLFSALNEQTIRPIASPVVDSKEAPALGKAFNFSAIVDILPQLAFDDYKGVAVSAEAFSVKDETLEREVNTLRRRHAATRPTEPGQPAAIGHLVAISHTAKQGGELVPSMNVNNMTVALGQNELYEGLENEILGMTVGQTKSADIALPDTYGDPELAGKTLTFDITLNDLKALDVPTFDDEFAKDLEFESAAALRDDIKKHLESRAKDMSRQKIETAVLDKILEKNPFEVPPAMVDQVIDSMIQELQFRSDDERARAMKDQSLRQNFLATARRRTQNTLILWHVTQKEQLQVTDDEVRARVDQALSSMGGIDPKQAARFRGNLEPRVRENLIFEKAMDFLIDNAKVTEVPAQI